MGAFFAKKSLIGGVFILLFQLHTLKAQNDTNDVIIDKNFKVSSEGQNFKIKSAKIDGDVLLLEVCVCKKYNKKYFALITNGLYAESFPPQLEIQLNQSKSIRCKEEKSATQKLAFNISKVKYKGSKELVLKLRNYSEALKYKYN